MLFADVLSLHLVTFLIFFTIHSHMYSMSNKPEKVVPGMRFQNMQEAIMHTSIDSVTP